MNQEHFVQRQRNLGPEYTRKRTAQKADLRKTEAYKEKEKANRQAREVKKREEADLAKAEEESRRTHRQNKRKMVSLVPLSSYQYATMKKLVSGDSKVLRNKKVYSYV